MKTMKQPLFTMLLLLTMLLAACGQEKTSNAEGAAEKETPQTEGSKMDITFWHAMGGDLQKEVEALASEFNASQDQYEVKPEFQGSYEEALTKFRTVGGTSDAPALIQTFEVGTKYMIDSGFIEPMQTFIDRDQYDVSQLEKNILNYYTVDDQLYSMPFNSSTPVLIYNKDAFKEAGLDPENPPRTYSDIQEAAKKLTEMNGGTTERYGFSMLTYGWFFEELLAVQGGHYVNEENGRKAEATQAQFNSEEGVNVFSWLNEMNQEGSFGNFGTVWDDIRAAFQSGKVAMYMDSSAGTRTIIDNSDFEVGVGFIPHPDNTSPEGVIIGGASLWMSKGIAKEQQEGAWEFMKFLASPETQAKWHVKSGYFAINPAAYDQPIVQEEYSKYPQLKVTVEQLQATKASTATQGALISVFPESRQHVVTALEKLYQGADPKEVLDEAASQTDRAIEIANKTKQ
jgi:sn-glycerol 3-phosphate transport system substrate-binding protein